MIGLLAMAMLALPASARDWTPHTAAALLDASFPTAEACEQALTDARRRESKAHPVHGLSYTNLFAQGRCHSFSHDNRMAWRIRMHWKQRETPRLETASDDAGRANGPINP
jgi:hypothetical protein